jgi:uncharacterized LabA/DUF88 family protein
MFVDGGNMFHSVKALDAKLDYEKMKNTLVNGRQLLRPYYYSGRDDTSRQNAFFEVLQYIGYAVKTLSLRQYEGKSFERGIDVMLVTDMLMGAHRDLYDTAILCSGDKGYIYAIKAIKEMGKRVEIAGFEHSTAKELRLIADRFINLTSILDQISE